MEVDRIEAEEKKTGSTGLQKVKKGLRLLCSTGVYSFLFFLVAIYSLYAPEGYIQIATHKYLFLKKLCLVTAGMMGPFVILYYVIPSGKRSWRELAGRISVTDIFVFLFACFNIVTYLGTEYREEALWGTSGWYMGFAMQLFFVGIYFFISRFYDGKVDVLPFFMGATFIVFLWGLLNRFSIYPIDMQYYHEQFISSLGNINWFCGYWSVFFVIGVVLYVITEKRWMRILSSIYNFVALGLAVVEGSDSAFLSMGVVFFFLFLIAFRKTEYMKRLIEEGIFYCTACQILRIIVKLDKERLTMDSSMMWLMLGNLTLVVLVILGILRIFIGKKDREYQRDIKANLEANTEEELSEKEWIWKWIWVKYVVVGLMAAAFVVYLVLLFINTRAPGILGYLSKYKAFLFNGSWGNGRGVTWRDGFFIYQSFSLRERLFGVGQDCFAIYGYDVPEISARLKEEWLGSRLTNAHNECITYLVNIGIFGMISFIGIFGSSFKRLLEKARKEPVCYVFAASLLSYFLHNQFSFSQVLSTPYIYMMLGLGESLMRRCDENMSSC